MEMLFDEHTELRGAVWEFLTHRAGHELASEAIAEVVRFDAAGSFAALGSLRGYHRPELERKRDWASQITELVDDWEHTSLL